MSNGGPLALVLAALKELGGYFVWADLDGEEYVIMSRRDFEARLTASREEQLELLGRADRSGSIGDHWTADDMLEKINRDLALYQLQREEEETKIDEAPAGGQEGQPGTPGKKVRFEPLRGDLPPELQE